MFFSLKYTMFEIHIREFRATLTLIIFSGCWFWHCAKIPALVIPCEEHSSKVQVMQVFLQRVYRFLQ